MREMPVDALHQDPTMIMVHIDEQPAKAPEGEVQTSPEEIREIAEDARRAVVAVDYSTTYGSCMDERPRDGLLSGKKEVKPRPSSPGGPEVYGLAVAELTGQFPDTRTDGKGRLGRVMSWLKGKLQPGGHLECAANEKLGVWLPLIADLHTDVSEYTQGKLDDEYDPALMQEVIDRATEAKDSGRYGEWTGAELIDGLGDEAGTAIEKLKADPATGKTVPHLGKVFIFNEMNGTTVDQNVLDNRAFILDIPYMATIEASVTAGPDAARQALRAKHARYAIVRALQHALPNPELYDVTLRK